MTAMHLTRPDYVVIAGYFVVVLWVGFWFSKRQLATSDYFAGGHQIPWWLAGISHYMSSFSAFTFVAYSQMAYLYGWVAITLFWVSIPACILGGLVFARRWRRARVITPVEFLEKRFNAGLRQLFGWAGIPVKVFDDALKVVTTGLFVSVGVGLDLNIAILLCGAVMVTYTLLGGLWALVVTDYVQFLMKITAMLLLLPMAIWRAGGPSHALEGLPAGFFHPTGGPYGWIYVGAFALLMAMSYNASWALAQKYYSVPDERSASRAAYLAAALNFAGTPIMLLPAMIGRRFLPDLVAQHRTADTYALLILTLLPVGMVGVMVAAIFSATMANISADLNAMASVLTKDVYHRTIDPGASEKALVRVGRAITAVVGVVIVVLALWVAWSRQQSLFHVLVTAFGLLLAPTLLPLLAGLTVRGLTWRGALAGFCAGLLAGIATLAIKIWYLPTVPGLAPDWVNYTFEGISILINISATCLGMWIGSVALPQDAGEPARIQEFFRKLDQPVLAAECPAKQPVAAGRATGACTAAVGALLVVAGALAADARARQLDWVFGLALAAVGALSIWRSRRLS